MYLIYGSNIWVGACQHSEICGWHIWMMWLVLILFKLVNMDEVEQVIKNEIFRDRLVTLINIKCRMFLGLNPKDVQNVLDKILQ